MSALTAPRRRKSLLAMSFGFAFIVMIFAVGAVVLSGATAEAATYTLTSTISGGSATFSGTAGSMSISGLNFVNNGTTTYSAGTNSVSLNSGAISTNSSGATFNWNSSNAMGTDNVSSPTFNNAGTINVSPLTAGANCILNNTNTISIPTTGQTFGLNGGGTHTGNFSFGSGGSTLKLNGAHTFNAGSA